MDIELTQNETSLMRRRVSSPASQSSILSTSAKPFQPSNHSSPPQTKTPPPASIRSLSPRHLLLSFNSKVASSIAASFIPSSLEIHRTSNRCFISSPAHIFASSSSCLSFPSSSSTLALLLLTSPPAFSPAHSSTRTLVSGAATFTT